ncbi:hypothetical protein DM02DRAFT_311543 [Periconia macrospinosa]|uniref:Uncharacterized protein n=1 Tax=Periconia macrospinosa TaxID=97972 RepID=A0A2V1D1G5_9PLEO|nr:hypothetical protein DM02DRAFT_311543 [Periconia macrospinosa]
MSPSCTCTVVERTLVTLCRHIYGRRGQVSLLQVSLFASVCTVAAYLQHRQSDVFLRPVGPARIGSGVDIRFVTLWIWFKSSFSSTGRFHLQNILHDYLRPGCCLTP